MSRRVWRAHDARFTADPAIEALGESYGPGGPLVVSVLLDMAKLQYAGGKVEATFREIAHNAFLPKAGDAQAIVVTAADLGIVEIVKEKDWAVILRFPRWDDWQTVTSAARMKKHRQKGVTGDAKSSASDTGSVTSDPPQDRTVGEETSPRTPPSVESSPRNGRGGPATISELFAYWQQQCGHPHAKLGDDRRRKIEARLKQGYTPEQIRRGIEGAAAAAFVSDTGKRHDDIELICRSGSKLEDFIDRAGSREKPLDKFIAGFGGRG